MENRIVTKAVQITTMNQEWEDERKYDVSLNTIKKDGVSRVFIGIYGVDDECDGVVGLPVEDVHLLIQALKDFC